MAESQQDKDVLVTDKEEEATAPQGDAKAGGSGEQEEEDPSSEAPMPGETTIDKVALQSLKAYQAVYAIADYPVDDLCTKDESMSDRSERTLPTLPPLPTDGKKFSNQTGATAYYIEGDPW
uniref:Uncharacterized protein n=1 Tax=Acanthochromis polyacanthus TaxID=80966 RepID=A0A3Q1FCT0_9TELE